MNIALDAMGGDNAPFATVHGALEAARTANISVLLVGDPKVLEPMLPADAKRLRVVPALETVGMDEKPLEALRRKPNSSLAVAAQLVKAGEASAMVSAGNTGATAAAALLSWRQLPGVHRPAIASFFPSQEGGFMLLDAGASPDVDADSFVEFALLGRAYAQRMLGRANPRVHLLNIGEEPGKGNVLAKQAHELLAKHGWFAGNIEGKDMFRSHCDVVVCDAFVGNIVLKTSEGIAEYMASWMRELITKSFWARLGFLPVRRALQPMKRQMDYAEHGGSPLLGLNGVCFICHGRSDARAIRNALLQADKAMRSGMLEAMREAFVLEAAV